MEINTTKKYNNGLWTTLTAAREFKAKQTTENGSLKVNSESHEGSPTAPITAKHLPDLADAAYYLGGVPPGRLKANEMLEHSKIITSIIFTGFKSGTTKAPGADHPYLGCMKDIQINGEVYDPLDSSSYYGVEPNCQEAITM